MHQGQLVSWCRGMSVGEPPCAVASGRVECVPVSDLSLRFSKLFPAFPATCAGLASLPVLLLGCGGAQVRIVPSQTCEPTGGSLKRGSCGPIDPRAAHLWSAFPRSEEKTEPEEARVRGPPLRPHSPQHLPTSISEGLGSRAAPRPATWALVDSGS